MHSVTEMGVNWLQQKRRHTHTHMCTHAHTDGTDPTLSTDAGCKNGRFLPIQEGFDEGGGLPNPSSHLILWPKSQSQLSRSVFKIPVKYWLIP